jgi:hypothetical protein
MKRKNYSEMTVEELQKQLKITYFSENTLITCLKF